MKSFGKKNLLLQAILLFSTLKRSKENQQKKQRVLDFTLIVKTSLRLYLRKNNCILNFSINFIYIYTVYIFFITNIESNNCAMFSQS